MYDYFSNIYADASSQYTRIFLIFFHLLLNQSHVCLHTDTQTYICMYKGKKAISFPFKSNLRHVPESMKSIIYIQIFIASFTILFVLIIASFSCMYVFLQRTRFDLTYLSYENASIFLHKFILEEASFDLKLHLTISLLYIRNIFL